MHRIMMPTDFHIQRVHSAYTPILHRTQLPAFPHRLAVRQRAQATQPDSTVVLSGESTSEIDTRTTQGEDPTVFVPSAREQPRLDTYLLPNDDGPPRFFTPLVPYEASKTPSALPLLLYLPGIDGTGLAARSQFSELVQHFELRCLYTPAKDRTPFRQQVAIISAYLEEHVAAESPERPVYLLGESYGGLLALAVAAAAPTFVDRVILVNPATSFPRSIWPQLGPLLTQTPPEAYRLLPYVLSPILANPVGMAARVIDNDRPLAEQLPQLGERLVQQLGLLGRLSDVLPQATLAWKLNLLQQGCDAVGETIGTVEQRVLLLASDNDLLIPSGDEGPRLRRRLKRCQTKVRTVCIRDVQVVPERGHALLQEAGVSLMVLLEEEGFYVRRRKLTTVPPSRKALKKFGQAGPIELPTSRELQRSLDGSLERFRRFISPVFLSTAADGQLVQGLSALPSSRPLVFVGNHQLLAADMYVLMEQFLVEWGRLPRGLAHPAVFGTGNRQRAVDSGSFSGFLATYGAVPVNGKNFYRLLEQGEDVLLFPGGVSEAYHLKGQQYKVLWPKKPEFVRMAARFGATIVPFGAIGAYDSLELLRDSSELRQTPGIGPWLEQRLREVPKVRHGNGIDEAGEVFAPPLTIPKVPARFYFLFGKPIVTQLSDLQSPERVESLYAQSKASVEDCIDTLLRKRGQDPYANFLPRILYEASWGGKQAPSFPLQ